MAPKRQTSEEEVALTRSSWCLSHPRARPDLVASALESRHLTPHIKPFIFYTIKHVCRAVVSEAQLTNSHPHLAPRRQRHILYFAVTELGKTLTSLTKTNDVCIKQMDEPQSSPNTSDILPAESSPEHQPKTSWLPDSI